MRVLYAGDSPSGGPANYLLAILRRLKVDLTHVPPGVKLKPSLFKTKFNLIIFSDYGSDCVSGAVESIVVQQVKQGAGFLMVGGWGSFSGPFGNWRGTEIESILPVDCLDRDDRINFPSGAVILKLKAHPSVQGNSFLHSPVICGQNLIKVKANAQTVLSVKPLIINKSRVEISKKQYPLLVVSSDKSRFRSAAFACDFAPHWCGGMVDWGERRMTLPVDKNIKVEVGDQYVAFISQLLSWIGSSK